MFSFLSPWFLAGALAAAVPIVLHLMRREPEARVKFAPVALLKHAPVEHSERRRLRELVLLALRVAAIVLLAVAFARPFVGSGDLQVSGATIVALDTSMSLSAPGQFERAKQLARAAVENAPSGHVVGVVTFADTAQVAAAPSGDRRVANAAIESAAPGLGGTRYAGAVARAVELVGGRAGAIVVVTDLQARGWDGGDRLSVPSAIGLSVEDVGEGPPNLSISSVRAAGERVVATVRSAGGEAREARVRLLLDEGRTGSGEGPEQKVRGETLVHVAPGGSAEAVLEGARGAAASVVVDDPGGIQGDDVRYVVLDGGGPPLVKVVTASGDVGRDAFYVDQALKASGEAGSAYRVEGLAAGRAESWTAEQLDAAAAVLLVSTRGLDRRGREVIATWVRKGGGLLIAAGAEVEGDVTADILGGAVTLAVPTAQTRVESPPASIVPVDGRHPIFRAFGRDSRSLGFVRFDRVAQVNGDTCRTLARLTTGEPVLVECAGAGRVLVFASDLDHRWNDFPVHATFVPFVQEAVRYLAGARVQSQEYLIGDVPQGIPPRPGTAMLNDASTGTARLVAVNVDPGESEPERVSRDAFFDPVARVDEPAVAGVPESAREQEDHQQLWRYALWLMLAVLILESALGARTA